MENWVGLNIVIEEGVADEQYHTFHETVISMIIGRIILDVTDDQVIPSTLPNNFSHPMIIRGCYSKAKEKHQDEVDVIT